MITGSVRALPVGVLLLAAIALSACTLEQIFIGQWYDIQTPRAGACPSLQWHFAVNPQRAINGFLTAGTQQELATLSGLLKADDSFAITATDTVRRRTATVTGQFTSQISTIAIHGDAAGTACDGLTFDLRLGSYFASQGGGGGGGGN